jgi:DNA-binding transcriptional MocR family regulator
MSSQKELEAGWREIREGGVVFRRLKFALKGYPKFIKENENPRFEREFSIVQFGGDVTNPDNPDLTDRCRLQKGRVMDDVRLNLFIVTKDMSRIYDELVEWPNHYVQNLWLINDHIYGEFYNEKGDVKLSELRATDNVIHLESVCLYHYTKSAHKE